MNKSELYKLPKDILVKLICEIQENFDPICLNLQQCRELSERFDKTVLKKKVESVKNFLLGLEYDERFNEEFKEQLRSVKFLISKIKVIDADDHEYDLIIHFTDGKLETSLKSFTHHYNGIQTRRIKYVIGSYDNEIETVKWTYYHGGKYKDYLNFIYILIKVEIYNEYTLIRGIQDYLEEDNRCFMEFRDFVD